MYLLIGPELDRCCHGVAAALRAMGHAALQTSAPLGAEHALAWRLETDRSEFWLACRDAESLEPLDLAGVFVRAPVLPPDPGGWLPEDHAYVRAELDAALVAWLRALPCRVINRPTADTWFRPRRSPLEWRPDLEGCGLPTLAMQVTNDIARARAVAAGWGGLACYLPLTSATRYAITSDAHWDQLGKLMQLVPVCLAEPADDQPSYATLVGDQVFWAAAHPPSAAEQRTIEVGLRRLAARFEAELIQLELRGCADGLRSCSASLYPQLGHYAEADQGAIATAIAQMLIAQPVRQGQLQHAVA